MKTTDDLLNELQLFGLPVRLETCTSGWACNVWHDESDDPHEPAYVRAYGLESPREAVRIALEIVRWGRWTSRAQTRHDYPPLPIVYGRCLKPGKLHPKKGS
jgi:hypothetical protein